MTRLRLPRSFRKSNDFSLADTEASPDEERISRRLPGLLHGLALGDSGHLEGASRGGESWDC
jgi:hypothetical protein